MMHDATHYPGQDTSAADLYLLAEEYRRAATVLLKLGRAGQPVSLAPFRLAAIHAIELYLNVWMLLEGRDPSEIRGLRHDLEKRAAFALSSKLMLRAKTAAHLVALSQQREYLVSRYAPTHLDTLSQTNRMAATLDELASKVGKRVAQSEPSPKTSVRKTLSN